MSGLSVGVGIGLGVAGGVTVGTRDGDAVGSAVTVAGMLIIDVLVEPQAHDVRPKINRNTGQVAL